ncbi:hypothetical protein VitviT2T_023187 [Vitis vinifera]|uniref:Uncharacterized protein n=1 Tax=Vitis vinifera TaxID=29760 RepID=A0ABY9DC08_VITVI|nr:hypothetical protein VitviT2T_023187 [Vitis vinifera]
MFGSKRALKGGRITAVEEEPGMSGPKREVTGDEEEAFPRHTQVSTKEGSCRQRSSEAERRPAEAEMPKKNGEAGFGED